MSATGLEVFDTTVQKTNAWLKDLIEVTGGDRHKAYQALRAVLHARCATGSRSRKRPNSERNSPC
jgi:hypothetical protein